MVGSDSFFSALQGADTATFNQILTSIEGLVFGVDFAGVTCNSVGIWVYQLDAGKTAQVQDAVANYKTYASDPRVVGALALASLSPVFTYAAVVSNASPFQIQVSTTYNGQQVQTSPINVYASAPGTPATVGTAVYVNFLAGDLTKAYVWQ